MRTAHSRGLLPAAWHVGLRAARCVALLVALPVSLPVVLACVACGEDEQKAPALPAAEVSRDATVDQLKAELQLAQQERAELIERLRELRQEDGMPYVPGSLSVIDYSRTTPGVRAQTPRAVSSADHAGFGQVSGMPYPAAWLAPDERPARNRP